MDRNTFVFVVATLAAIGLLFSSGYGFAGGLVVLAVAFTVLWLVSLPLENAGIVDIFWGPGFILVGAYYATTVSGAPTLRGLLVLGLVTVWGLRLALYIGIRNAGAGEDFRYRKWREEAGTRFWWISLVKVFLLQALVLWIVSSPLLLAQLDGGENMIALDVLGIALWGFGLLFETVADWQLLRFKKRSTNAGRVMRSGLWSVSRHPNYFGEAVLWWGIGLLAVPGGGWLALVGPLMINFLLLKVSGVVMLDTAMVERRPAYADYISTVPAFVPRLRFRYSSEPQGTERS
jgi:steroid 5-alpha reductase family enzyme